MNVRSFFAVAASALLLNLNVVRADVACATHEMPSPESTPAEHHPAGHTGHEQTSSDTAADESNCDTPVQKDCCHAVTSCSPALGFSAEREVADWVPAHEAASLAYTRHSLSRTTAPEPPPPRV